MRVMQLFQKDTMETLVKMAAVLSNHGGDARDENGTMLEILKSVHMIPGFLPKLKGYVQEGHYIQEEATFCKNTTTNL